VEIPLHTYGVYLLRVQGSILLVVLFITPLGGISLFSVYILLFAPEADYTIKSHHTKPQNS
jgi:hypothetical protein